MVISVRTGEKKSDGSRLQKDTKIKAKSFR
jgi:hypothetical protein